MKPALAAATLCGQPKGQSCLVVRLCGELPALAPERRTLSCGSASTTEAITGESLQPGAAESIGFWWPSCSHSPNKPFWKCFYQVYLKGLWKYSSSFQSELEELEGKSGVKALLGSLGRPLAQVLSLAAVTSLTAMLSRRCHQQAAVETWQREGLRAPHTASGRGEWHLVFST